MYRSDCLPFSEIPHTSALFLDFLYHFDRLERFLPAPLRSAQQAAEAARAVNAAYDGKRRAAVVAVLEQQNQQWGLSESARRNLERLRAGAMAIVTGQQVNLFGGPAYSFYKALTIIKVAQEFTAGGTECVPIFWLASEDHDVAEIDHVALPRPEMAALEMVRASAKGNEGAPVGRLKLDDSVLAAVARAAELLGPGEALDAVRAAYAPGETFVSAFARLFARVFADCGLLMIDPDNRELHGIAQPIFAGAVERSVELNRIVQERGRELEAAGYHQQVKVTSATSFLFALEDGARVPVRRNGSGFLLGNRKLSAAELQQRVNDAPQDFSPNALLRTSVQNHLLPTLMYCGGPAEIAYLAQAAALERALVGRTAPLMHRFSATIVEARAQRLLQRYELKPADTFQGPEHLRERIAERRLPHELEARFEKAEQAVKAEMRALREQLAALDATLVDAASHSGEKMEYQIKRLRARAARALLRRTDELGRHADQLSTALYPQKTLQERTYPGIYFLARLGTASLRDIYQIVHPDCPDHQIVFV